jgi:hypothetical protein
MKHYIIIGMAALTGVFFLTTGGMAMAADKNPAQALAGAPNLLMPHTTNSQAVQSPPFNQGGISTAAAVDIRDIRGPLHIPNPLLWLYYAGGGCLLLIAGIAAWRWYLRRKVFRAKYPFEIAFEQLERARALMQPGKGEKFSVAVSNAIRTYIEKCFDVGVTHHTTEEFMANIAAEPLGDLGEHSALLHDFLAHCDLAKFARYALTVDQMKEMHQSAWQFVEKTRPRPEEKTCDQKSEVSEEMPCVTGVSRKPSFYKALWAKGRKLIPKKTMMPAGFAKRRAVIAGGR